MLVAAVTPPYVFTPLAAGAAGRRERYDPVCANTQNRHQRLLSSDEPGAALLDKVVSNMGIGGIEDAIPERVIIGVGLRSNPPRKLLNAACRRRNRLAGRSGSDAPEGRYASVGAPIERAATFRPQLIRSSKTGFVHLDHQGNAAVGQGRPGGNPKKATQPTAPTVKEAHTIAGFVTIVGPHGGLIRVQIFA